MSPTELARAVADASDRQATSELLALTHPRAADRFKERQLAALEAVPWQDLKQRAGPRAQKLRNALADNQQLIVTKVYGVGSLAELRELPPLELLGRRMDAAFKASSPATRDHLAHVTVVGAVERDPDTAYVILERRTRTPAGPVPSEPLATEVMRARRAGTDWRSMLDAGLVGLGSFGLFVLGAESAGPHLSI